MYVADAPLQLVETFSAAGAFEGSLTGKGTPTGHLEPAGGVAVEAGTGDVYLVNGEPATVDQYSQEGAWLGWLTGPANGSFALPHGVALGAAGDVYVSDRQGTLANVFGPNVVVPDASTGAATKVGRTSATLGGTINPRGVQAKGPASWYFEYGPSTAYGSKTAEVSAGSGEAAVKVSQSATGLSAGTVYHYRLVTRNANGVNHGADAELETAAAVSGVETGPANNIEPHAATLTGSLAPEGVDAHYYFEYGETETYGGRTAEADAGSGASAAAATQATGLKANDTYHYRIVAVNSFGTTYGGDATLTTTGPPTITPQAPEPIGPTSATLRAQIAPGKLDTHYHFEYGETSAYGTVAPVPDADIGAGEAAVPVSAELSGLARGATYHYRVVATNAAGTVYGPDEELITTPPAPSTASPRPK